MSLVNCTTNPNTVLALVASLAEEIELLRESVDALAARQDRQPEQMATALAVQLRPELNAARRAARLRRSR